MSAPAVSLIVLATLVLWVAIVVGGVKVAHRKNRSAHWMWFAVHPLSGLIALVVLLLVKPVSRCPHCGARLPAHSAVCPACRHDPALPAEAAPEPTTPTEPIVATGTFRKVSFKALDGYGRYRGEGQLAVGDEGVTIAGRHVYPLGARWTMAVAIFLASVISSLMFTGGAFLLAPGLIPLYLFVEYVWLKREELRIRWDDVSRFAAHPAGDLLAIEFRGPAGASSPVVLKTRRWRELAAWLRARVPDREVAVAPGGVRSTRLPILLIVIIVVLLVIGIAAAITIPNLLEARRRAEAMRKAATGTEEAISGRVAIVALGSARIRWMTPSPDTIEDLAVQ